MSFLPAPLPDNEPLRLQALCALQVLDTPDENAFDDLTRVAALACATPIALVSLVDADRQWFKSRVGLEARETPRDVAFCAHVVHSGDYLEVPDATQDPRFAGNPLVTGAPHVCFYAGMPLRLDDGQVIGTLCVIDHVPRVLTDSQRDMLCHLSHAVVEVLRSRQQRMAAEKASGTLQHLLDVMPDGVVACDADGTLQVFNATAERWHGVEGKNLPQQEWSQRISLFEPDGETPLMRERRPLWRLIHGESIDGQLVCLKTAHAPPRILECMGQRLVSSTGALTGGLLLLRDITRAHEEQRALQEERRRLAMILEGTQAGSWEWNVQTGEVRFNERWAGMLGYLLDELTPLSVDTWASFMHPDDLNAAKELLDAHFAGRSDFYQMPVRMRHRDGYWRWIFTCGRVLNWTEDRQPIWMTGIHLDIHEQKQLGLLAEETQLFLQAVVDASRDVAIIATDCNGVIKLFNSGAEQLLGYAAEDLVGQHTPALFHLAEEVQARGDDLSRQQGRTIAGFEVFVHQARQGQTETRQWTYVRKNGEHRQVRLSISALKNSDSSLHGFLGMVVDITEQLALLETASQNEQRFRSAFDSAVQGMALVSLTGRWKTVNEALCHMLGRDADELLALDTAAVMYPADRGAEQALRARVLSRTVPGDQADLRFLHRDGRLVWGHVSVSLVCDRLGSPLQLVLMVQDVSLQRHMQQALQDSEQRLRDIIRSLPGVVLQARADRDWKLTFVSEQIKDLSGYAPQDFLAGKGFAELVLPEDLPPTYAAVTAERLAAQQDFYELKYRLRDREGRVRWVQERGKALRDHSGEVNAFIGFVWDVSVQHEKDEALAARERFLQALFDNVVDAVITIDIMGTITAFNRAAERMFGYSEAEILGSRITALMPAAQRAAHDESMVEYERTGKTHIIGVRREVTGLRRDGETFPLELSVTEILESGQQQFVGVARDLSERKRIDRMKADFVSTISHELRTPLTSISGALGVVLGGALGELPATLRHMLQIAQNNSHRLTHLINDLLDMDKLIAGKMQFELRDLTLQDLLIDAQRSNQSFADRYQVRIVLPAPAPTDRVRVDPVRFAQVMANLLSNACKYAPAGDAVRVEVEALPAQIRLSICDRGPGIPPHFRERIFQRFSQANSGADRDKGGTGLGLAICKELVERMGGTIGYDTRHQAGADSGTTFWFTVPRA